MIGFVSDLISGLGVGGQLASAVTIAAIGWYLWRVGALAGAIASVFASARTIGIAIAVVLAGAVALGWIDLSISSMMSDIASAGSRLPEFFRDLLGVIPI